MREKGRERRREGERESGEGERMIDRERERGEGGREREREDGGVTNFPPSLSESCLPRSRRPRHWSGKWSAQLRPLRTCKSRTCDYYSS